jgi:antitoxin MazE6
MVESWTTVTSNCCRAACATESRGYTPGMKTAISVPDDVFEEAEALARRARRSRSELYSTAMREYIARHSTDDVTAALDQVVADVGGASDPLVQTAAGRILAASDW